MKFKNTLLLFVVMALVVGGYFLAEKRVPTTKETTEKEKHLFDLKAADVTEIEIKGADRDFLFERRDQKWNLKKPIQVRANASEIDRILSSIEYLERRRSLSPKEVAEAKYTLSDYGLDKPRLTVKIKTKQKTLTLQIGNETKQGNNLYLQTSDDPDIHLADKDLAAQLNKKLDEYRERSLFDFSPDQVRRFEIRDGTKLVEFSRTNDVWQIVQPLSARADTAKVDGFLYQTCNLRADDFLSEDPAASKEFGLEEPSQEVTLKIDQQDAVNTLLLGSKLKSDEQKMAAKIKGQNSLVSIPIGYKAELGKPLNEFRDRRLGTYTTDDIHEIKLETRQVVVTIQRQNRDWKIIEPEKMDADTELVEKLISRLNSAMIKEFAADVVTDLDKYALKNPISTITLRGKTPQTGDATKTNATPVVHLSLAIGREDTSRKLVYVKLADESSVYGLDPADAAGLPKNINDIRTRTLFEIKKDALKSCTQNKGKASSTLLYSKDGKWILAKNTQGVVDETAWQKFVNHLGHFNVEKIVGTALNTTIKQYGLDAPLATWTVETEVDGKPVVQECLVGRETPQKTYFILWKNQLLVCEITQEIHQILTSDWLKKPSSR